MDHKITCNKLTTYGVQHFELPWFQSYIANHKQSCRVNGIESETEDIEVGVPQDSCLGPFLFLIYVNDLRFALQDSNVSMYADDTSVCYQSNGIAQLNGAINIGLKKLNSWLQGNKTFSECSKNTFHTSCY